MTLDNTTYLTVTRPDRMTDGKPCVVAEHPELVGCVAYGKDETEAIANLAAARGAFLKSLADANEVIPPPAQRAQRVTWSMGSGNYPAVVAERAQRVEGAGSVSV